MFETGSCLGRGRQVEVDRVTAGDRASVLDRDSSFEFPFVRVGNLGRDRGDFQVLVFEGGIAKPEPEGKQGLNLAGIIMPVSDPDAFFIVRLAVE